MGRAAFGNVRRRASGRWQARYRHEGAWYTGPNTFETKADANAWLATTRADLLRGNWVDPTKGRDLLKDYAATWLASRHDLRPRTVELYQGLLGKHILPALGNHKLSQIKATTVRSWYADIAKTKPIVAAKAYRLLRTILATAASDGLIAVNPCTIKGAGTEHTAEREIPPVETLYLIAETIGDRYRALVLTAALAGLRLGELAALTRKDVDLAHKTISVEAQAQYVAGVGRVLGPPKSKAGVRTIAIPPTLVADLDVHIAKYVGNDPDALLFTADKGGPLQRSNWATVFGRTATAAGMPGLHFHDLRHLAGTLAAATGASTREIMHRLGHSTPRAALIYQHATAERDHQIADGIEAILDASRKAPTRGPRRSTKPNRRDPLP